jgi:hypothetical protein
VKHIKGYFKRKCSCCSIALLHGIISQCRFNSVDNKLNSLVRQLNLYGFSKTRDEE